jgi:hypothetical protein
MVNNKILFLHIPACLISHFDDITGVLNVRAQNKFPNLIQDNIERVARNEEAWSPLGRITNGQGHPDFPAQNWRRLKIRSN